MTHPAPEVSAAESAVAARSASAPPSAQPGATAAAKRAANASDVSPEADEPKVWLTIPGVPERLPVTPGQSLLKACREAKVNVFWGPWAKLLNCRGVARCTLCKVQVIDSAEPLPVRTGREEKRLGNRPADWRLACQVTVRGDMTIEPFPVVPILSRVPQEAIDAAALERRRLAGEEVAPHPYLDAPADPYAEEEDGSPADRGGEAEGGRARRASALLGRFRRGADKDADADDAPSDERAATDAEGGESGSKGKRGRFAFKGRKRPAKDDAEAADGEMLDVS